jgi:hypothetical protein
VNLALATSSALGAAALFAVATAVQSRALRGIDGPLARSGHAGYPSSPPVTTSELRLVIRAVTSRIWIVGTAIATAAFALHALALHEGQLTLVQPLLVTMVLFALPASRAVNGTAVTAAELRWAVVLVLGLTAFFAAADPVRSSTANADLGPAILTATLAALTIALCVGLARHRPGGQAAALLGGAAGIAFAGVAALVKSATDLLAHGVGALVGSWQLFALLGLGAIGIGLSQLAYRTGPLSASLPALNSVNPLVSVLIGAAVFDEHVRTGALPIGIEALALAVIALATMALSQPPAVNSPTLSGAAGSTQCLTEQGRPGRSGAVPPSSEGYTSSV